MVKISDSRMGFYAEQENTKFTSADCPTDSNGAIISIITIIIATLLIMKRRKVLFL